MNGPVDRMNESERLRAMSDRLLQLIDLCKLIQPSLDFPTHFWHLLMALKNFFRPKCGMHKHASNLLTLIFLSFLCFFGIENY